MERVLCLRQLCFKINAANSRGNVKLLRTASAGYSDWPAVWTHLRGNSLASNTHQLLHSASGFLLCTFRYSIMVLFSLATVALLALRAFSALAQDVCPVM